MSPCIPFIWKCDEAVPSVPKHYEISGEPPRAWNMGCCTKLKLIKVSRNLFPRLRQVNGIRMRCTFGWSRCRNQKVGPNPHRPRPGFTRFPFESPRLILSTLPPYPTEAINEIRRCLHFSWDREEEKAGTFSVPHTAELAEQACAATKPSGPEIQRNLVPSCQNKWYPVSWTTTGSLLFSRCPLQYLRALCGTSRKYSSHGFPWPYV